MNVVLAGAGAFGKKHLDGIQNIDAVEAICIVDPVLELANKVAEQYGVNHVSADLAEALALPGVDAVILATPTPMHASQAIQCMEAGKHVQVEIPMADSVADAEAVVAKQVETGLVAKLKRMLGGDKKKEGKVRHGGMKTGAGGGTNKLADSQKHVGKGHVDLAELLKTLEEDPNVKKEIDLLAEGTTQIEQVLYWQIFDGDIYYRILLQPYDRAAHEMMMKPGEALFMSFMSGNGERKVPKSADHRIDMKYLRVATKEGYAAGWFYDGVLPLDGVNPESVAKGKVGWIFSNGLHARLRQIQAPKRPAGNKTSEPFSIDIPVDDSGRPTGK